MARDRRLSLPTACSLLVAVLAHTALGQDATTRTNLKSLRDTLAKTRGVLSRDAGERAQHELKRWNLTPTDLDSEARTWLREVQIYAALAVGDARQAAETLPRLTADSPDARHTLRLSWLVAGAVGDAELAQRTLEQLKKTGLASDAAIAKRQARLTQIGRPAPDETVNADSGDPIALRDRRGNVLVLDFWTLRDQPSDKHIAALRDLVRQSRGQVTFLGINSDGPNKVATARKFAKKHDLKWPHHYERAAANPPLTDTAFGVADFPWNVLIDGEGNVRAVGTARAHEFQYAVRAAVAESQGTYATVRPRTTDGVVAKRPATNVSSTSEKEKDQAKPDDPPHHPEAQRLLDQARLYLKTGRKRDAKKLLQELIEKYPDTWEAREARRMGLI